MTTTYMPDVASVAADTRGGGTWWLAASRALDDLVDRLSSDALVEDGPKGVVTEAVWTAPNLAPSASRLRHERDALLERARGLRRRISDLAGDPAAVDSVAQELAEVARDEKRYRKLSVDLVWDSVNRDLGGE